MRHGKAQVVALHEGEGGRGNIHGPVVANGTDEGARKAGLARSEVAMKRQHVARFQGHGDVFAQPSGRRLVRKEDGE